MANEIPRLIWWVILLVLPLLALLGAVLVGRYRTAAPQPEAWAFAGVLALWFVGALLLGAGGVFQQAPDSPVPAIGLGVALPLLLGLLALWRWRGVRDAVLAIPQHWLVGIQTTRLVGGVFLALVATGALPGLFGLPAGGGDVAVGLAAPLVAFAAWRGLRAAPWAVGLWNVLGIADLLVAVGIAFLASSNPFRVFLTTPSTDAMTALPLVLIPTFGVPLFLLLHAASLSVLWRERVGSLRLAAATWLCAMVR